MKYQEQVLPDYEPASVLSSYTNGRIPCFFDIETTGLSPKANYVYLIGSLSRSDGNWTFRQWFAENIDEEPEILRLFQEALSSEQVLIHYNGATFDIPFLKERCRRYGLPDALPEASDTLDLFRMLYPTAALFHTANRKQPTMEKLSGFTRTDCYDGGTLVGFYTEYVGRCRYDKARAEELLHDLLLHNHDDVIGLADIPKLLAYRSVKETDYHNAVITTNPASVTFSAEIPYRLPMEWKRVIPLPDVPPECRSTLVEYVPPEDFDGYYLTVLLKENRITVTAPLYRMAPFYYYPNYKDYYYLPVEKRAIHKSLAACVDKAYREPATKETARQSKNGTFLPQIAEAITPAFRFRHNDELSFFEPSSLKEESVPVLLSDWLSYAEKL